jgi:transcriptional regulator with XRE-family HTH domain
MVRSDQLRAARALLRLDQQDVAHRAGVSVATLRRVEADEGVEAVGQGSVDRVREALESLGVEFIENGVRRRLCSRTSEDREAMFQDIMRIAERAAARKPENPEFGEEDLYDVNGLPA